LLASDDPFGDLGPDGSELAAEADDDVVDWFTTERLLWARQQGMPGISGLNNCIEALTYELLYVGIAKAGDSFDRLIHRLGDPRHPSLGASAGTYVLKS
jgi:hypothetical protein